LRDLHSFSTRRSSDLLCLTLLGISAIGLVLKHALVDPHLDADMTLRGHGFRNSVIDVRSQGAQRNRSGNLLFAASHFRTAEAARSEEHTSELQSRENL